MSEYKGESRSMWRKMPERAAERMLLNDSFCSSLRKDIKREMLLRALLITAARRNAMRVPPKKE